MVPKKSTYQSCVASAIRAELARRDLSRLALSPVLELDKNAVYARLRGDTPFTTTELERIAQFLHVPVAVLAVPARSLPSLVA